MHTCFFRHYSIRKSTWLFPISSHTYVHFYYCTALHCAVLHWRANHSSKRWLNPFARQYDTSEQSVFSTSKPCQLQANPRIPVVSGFWPQHGIHSFIPPNSSPPLISPSCPTICLQFRNGYRTACLSSIIIFKFFLFVNTQLHFPIAPVSGITWQSYHTGRSSMIPEPVQSSGITPTASPSAAVQ